MKFGIILACLSCAVASQTFPIAGVVVDGTHGTPMARVRVTLSKWGSTADDMALITKADGRFSFDVPKGKYRLLAENRGVRQQFGQSGPGTGFGVAIFTGPDEATSQLVFRWFQLSAISGKVVDERGEPVENALIQLIRSSVVAGSRMRRTLAWARTNDLGEYRFGQLLGGEYYLVVTGQPWYTGRANSIPAVLRKRMSNAQEERAPESELAYLPVYYPDANEPQRARPLALAAGAEATADFRLIATAGVNVNIHVPRHKAGGALVYLKSDGVGGAETFQKQVRLYGEDLTIPAVLPGHYTVALSADGIARSIERASIDVGAADVTVEIAASATTSVEGKVTFKDPSRRPNRALYVRMVDESNGAALMKPIDASGAVSFDDVPPGPRRIAISNADGFFARQIAVEGAALKQGSLIDIASGSHVTLNIVADDDVGRLKGFVTDGGKHVAGVIAVLAPKAPSGDPAGYRGFETDSDGSYDFQNVRAGDYVLFAASDLGLEYKNPAAIRDYVAAGKAIQIVAHQTTTEDTPLQNARSAN